MSDQDPNERRLFDRRTADAVDEQRHHWRHVRELGPPLNWLARALNPIVARGAVPTLESARIAARGEGLA